MSLKDRVDIRRPKLETKVLDNRPPKVGIQILISFWEPNVEHKECLHQIIEIQEQIQHTPNDFAFWLWL